MIRSKNRRGFTLIEVLVVLAIIGVLSGLLMAAVQQAREAARRTQCMNNLRQLGIGMHNFETAHRHLPPASLDSPTEGSYASVRGKHGWGAHLLPYLEQQPLAAQYRWDTDAESNSTVMAVQLKLFLCPSSANQGPADDGTGRTVGVTHYMPFTGVMPELYKSPGIQAHAAKTDGLLARQHGTRFADVSDGLSNTIALVENAESPNGYRLGVPIPGLKRPAASPFAFRNAGEFWGTCDAGGHVLLVTEPVYWNISNVSGLGDATGGNPYSSHPGIVNALFADGTVRSLSKSMPTDLFMRMLTRAGGETNE